MGSFAKKMSRKKVVETSKVIIKNYKKVSKAEHTGRMIAQSNLSRMDAYIKAWWGTCFAYVLRDTFGFSYNQIRKWFDEYAYLEDCFTTAEKYKARVSWFKAGLYIECKGFRIDPYNEWREPKEIDYVGWCQFYIDSTFKMMVRKNQIMFFWLLHDKFGFGRTRLDRAKEALRGMRVMSLNQYKSMWDKLSEMKVPKGVKPWLDRDKCIELMTILNFRPEETPDKPMEYQVVNQVVKRI